MVEENDEIILFITQAEDMNKTKDRMNNNSQVQVFVQY